MSKSKTLTLVEGAMLIAVATVLSYVKILDMPQGGSITLEMIPLVIMGLRNGTKWGCLTAFIHGLIQMILGFSNVMYCATLPAQIGCILLDYLLAFSVLGLAGAFYSMFNNKKASGIAVKVLTALISGGSAITFFTFLSSFEDKETRICIIVAAIACAIVCALTVLSVFVCNKLTSVVVATIVVGILRFICSFLSGWILWGSWAWENWSPATYSLAYNGMYMIPNIIIMAVVTCILFKSAPRLFKSEK